MFASSLRRAPATLLAHAQRRGYVASTIGAKAEPLSDSGSPDVPFYFLDDRGNPISPWHDIPTRQGYGMTNGLVAALREHSSSGNDGGGSSKPRSLAEKPSEAVFNMVCEIPRGSRAKYEVSTESKFNPIKFDRTKDGKPRLYAFPSLTNYGALPQTYENPDHTDEWTNLKGDGDPIDVCEIGTVGKAVTGGIYTVKILGALGMIDGGETDWKLLAIRTDDPLAASLHDIKNAPQSVIKFSDDIRSWFRTYKVPEGKPENEFAFAGKWLDRDTALEIVDSTHRQWRDLVRSASAAQEKDARTTSFGEAKVVAKALEGGPWVWRDANQRSADFNLLESHLARVRISHELKIAKQ